MFKPKIDIFKIFEKSNVEISTIKVYPAIEIEQDPFEKNTSKTMLNPVYVKCIFPKDFSFSSLVWEMSGLKDSGSKICICENKYYNLLKNCHKIIINSENFSVYQDASSGQFQIIKYQDYTVFIARKCLSRS